MLLDYTVLDINVKQRRGNFRTQKTSQLGMSDTSSVESMSKYRLFRSAELIKAKISPLEHLSADLNIEVGWDGQSITNSFSRTAYSQEIFVLLAELHDAVLKELQLFRQEWPNVGFTIKYSQKVVRI